MTLPQPCTPHHFNFHVFQCFHTLPNCVWRFSSCSHESWFFTKSPRSSGDSSSEKPLIITISGDLGSGKSLLASALVDRWKADRSFHGVRQRRLAERMGITTLELNKRAETDKSIDEQIDSVFS